MTNKNTQIRNCKDGSQLFTMANVGKGLPEPVHFKVPNAAYNIRRGLETFIRGKVEWQPEYDDVAEWLSDNHGKGLIMYGNCGRGKSVLGEHVIPELIAWYFRMSGEQKKVHICSYRDLNDDLYDLKNSYKMLYIDDLGQEEFAKVFGNTIHAFADIVDQAEKKAKLLIVSTNLTLDELQEKYGDRVISRLKGITKTIAFQGDDLRTLNNK